MPKQWKPGEPISAERLNDTNAEALRSRRDVNLGSGSSMVNEAMGNQSASPRYQAIKMVVATEDFAIPETPTDLSGVIDDVPSGLVREVRLNRRSGVHADDNTQRPFRAYDVAGGLNGELCGGSDSASASSSTSSSSTSSSSTSSSESAVTVDSKLQCDVFYVMFNQDSKRWEVLEGGGSIQLSHGIILEQCSLTCSTYRVQRVHRYLTPDCDPASESV
jgi:hypothetical protein